MALSVMHLEVPLFSCFSYFPIQRVDYRIYPDLEPVPQGFTGELAALEVEVEQINEMQLYNGLPRPWKWIPDGSLRNSGIEFKTPPMPIAMLPSVFRDLIIYLKTEQPKYSFSTRTSIHVHVNHQNATVHNVVNLILLYYTLEPVLMAKFFKEREHNNFCVPVMYQPREYDVYRLIIGHRSLPQVIKKWQKYSALNLIPLVPDVDRHVHNHNGTVEFRQLGGTDDVRRVWEWINIVGKLVQASRTMNINQIREKIMSLNTTSQYIQFLDDIFGASLINILVGSLPVSLIHQVMEKSVAAAKLFFTPPTKLSPTWDETFETFATKTRLGKRAVRKQTTQGE